MKHNINVGNIGAKTWHLQEASIYSIYRFIDNKWGDVASASKKMIGNAQGKVFDNLQPNTQNAFRERIKDALTYYANTVEGVIPNNMSATYGEECLGARLLQLYESTCRRQQAANAEAARVGNNAATPDDQPLLRGPGTDSRLRHSNAHGGGTSTGARQSNRPPSQG